MLKACGLFLTAMVFVFALIAPVHAGNFEGKWVGHWKNSLGESGRDSLRLYETRDGGLRGNWSGDVEVKGEQTSADSIRLYGHRDDGVRYRITAQKHHGEIELHYTATRRDGSTYEGWSELHRP
jgi:hypothetical protein